MASRYYLIFSLLLSFYSLSFAGDQLRNAPPEVQAALEKSGDNRLELGKVIAHYENLEDTLKLQAAYFLVANMEGHSYVTFALRDSAGTEVAFDNTAYVNYESLLADWEVIEKNYPGLDFEKKDVIDDQKVIMADFLIENIEFAFRAWREKPWAKGLSFEEFREYVLPYRGSNEPLESWREYFWQKYAGIATSMSDFSNPIEAARIINNDVMTYYTFDPRFYYHPTDQGLAEMKKTHLGRCEDMTNITIYAMRANGLAVTSDYTPYWANSGNNHAWNAIVTPDHKVLPFMGAEANPGEYSLWNKLAKVYRKMYSKQLGNLIFRTRKQQKVPGWLAGKNYIDVTSDYVKTSDVVIALEKAPPDTVDIAYICVFNDGRWQPIHWGGIENGATDFSQMGRGIVYLPAYYVNEDSLDPAGSPFILGEDGIVRVLENLESRMMVTSLISTTAKVQQTSTDGVDQVYFEPGKRYELYYWDDGWKSVGQAVATDKPLGFANVPEGFLYWLVADGSNKDERIFTIENGRQVWW
jgi:hypothetical protein